MEHLANTYTHSAIFSQAACMLALQNAVNGRLVTLGVDMFVKLVLLAEERVIYIYVTDAAQRLQLLHLLPDIHATLGRCDAQLHNFTIRCKVHPNE